MKYVSPLSEDEIKKLENIMRNNPSHRARSRSHAVLLSSKGYRMNDIADIFGVDRDTVSSWLDAWKKNGFEGLYDKPRSGRPPIPEDEEKKTAGKLTGENPRSPRKVIQLITEITGKTVSLRTLGRLAGAAALIWKRVRRSIRPKRNDAEFKKAKKKIGELEKRRDRGEIDIAYFDESGCDLQPTVPYAWQPKGETIEVPSSQSRRLSIVGFFNTETNALYSFIFEDSVNGDVVAACFDAFSERITKKTVVIMDNASYHTCDKFTENIEKWEKKGLFIMYIPACCPELNLIEILWRFIKHIWLPFSAYVSFESLREELEKVLKGVGSEYIINFS